MLRRTPPLKAKKTDRNWRSELYESLANIRRIERQMAEHTRFHPTYQEIVNCSGCHDLIMDVDTAYRTNGQWFHNTDCAETYQLERNQ